MKSKNRMSIGDIFLKWRKKNLMTQLEASEQFETDQGNISKIENGLRNIPREKVEWLAQVSGVKLNVVVDAWVEMDRVYGSEVL